MFNRHCEPPLGGEAIQNHTTNARRTPWIATPPKSGSR
jgi:hypothetical protein